MLLRLVLVLAALLAGCRRADMASTVLVLAATTTIEDSGLLDSLVVSFGHARPSVRVVPVTGGSGAVLTMGRRGDVDIMLTHDPVGERAFMAAGHGDLYRVVMHNHFVLAGPRADPARIAEAAGPVGALRRIARVAAPFVSRADDSGTHRKERVLWAAAGLAPGPGDAWYIEAGLGMGEALRLADVRDAYILTGPATLHVLDDVLDLVPLVRDGPALLNQYAVTRPVRARSPELARAFADWITGPEGHAVIGRFGPGAPSRLFVPGAPP